VIDFQNVRSVVIPEGEVSVIARGAEILWRKQTKQKLRYIKFVVTEVRTTNGTQMQFSELEFLDAVGNRFNYPNTTTVTSPDMSATSTVESPNKIIDGLTSTKFCTVKFATGRYLLIDLGELALDVNEFCAWRWWTGNDNYGRDPVSFELWGSADGDTYKLLDSAVKAEVPTARQVVAYTGKVEVPPDARLPADYKEVAYIESTGTQWIDTGIAGNNNNLRFEFAFNLLQFNAYRGLFGNYVDENTNCWRFIQTGSNNKTGYVNVNGKAANSRQVNIALNTVCTADISRESIVVNGKSFVPLIVNSSTNSSTVRLFNSGGFAASSSLRILYFKIYDSGVLVRDLVPCVRKADSKPGIYDLVTGEFFTNQGTDEFLYG
jgi:hypothetical protein